MKIDIADDLRQSVVIAKNEIKKFFSGKKIMIFGALILLVVALMTVIPYVFDSPYDSTMQIAVVFLMFMGVIIELAGVLFTSTSLVSEFEERTALILFTKPIRKWSIFTGKLMASMITVVAFIAIYFLYVIAFSYITQGGIADNLWRPFVLSICATFGICGISMLMSSIAKKGSTASIMTLVMLLLVISLFAALIDQFADIGTWWCITDAIDSMITSLSPMAPVDELARSGLVMIAWGITGNIAAFILFRKRDF